MLRRHLLLSSTALVAGGLVGCTGTNATLVSDSQLLANALVSVSPLVLSLTKDPAVAAKIQTYINDVSQVAAALPTASGTSTIQTLITDVQAVAPVILALVGIPPALTSTIQAAIALLPSIASAAGLTLDAATAPAMTAAAARIILYGAAHG